MNLSDTYAKATRLLFEVNLRPLQGTRFQPTGFPDIGPATYTGFNDEGQTCDMLLVESAQSMANRMEATIWDEANQDLIPELKGLPYVRVLGKDGNFLTSSILEAHRLNSAYIEKAKGGFHKQLKHEIYTKGEMIDNARIARTLLKYDPNCLIHGVFLESIAGRIRVPRALTAFIEASDIQRAASGGVKNDEVSPDTDKDAEVKRTANEGFGNVIFHHDEFAGRIKAYFNLDLAQIRGYRLPAEAQELLVNLSLLKLRSVLDRGLRLRTACDLEQTGDLEIRAIPDGEANLPSTQELLETSARLVGQCKSHFAEPPVTEVSFE